METKKLEVGKNLILKKVVMNSCCGGLRVLPPWVLRKGIHPMSGPITATSDSARRGEILNKRQRRVVTAFKRRKMALLGFLVYSQHLFVGDCKEK